MKFENPKYLISRYRLNTITTLAVLMLVSVVALAYWVYRLDKQLEVEAKQTEAWKQRSKAMDELLTKRMLIGKFTYAWACREAKRNMLECPKAEWWPRKEDYPALINDPTTKGILGED